MGGETTGLARMMSDLAASIVGAQVILDNEVSRDLRLRRAFDRTTTIPDDIEPLFHFVSANPLRVARVSVEVELHLVERRTREIGIGIDFLGIPAHQLFRSRFEERDTRYSRLELVCEAVEASPVDQAGTERGQT